MNFKLWLESPQDKYSWLDPSGRFYPVSHGYNHGSFAANILKNKIDDSLLSQSLIILMKRGWQRVIFYGSELIANNDQVKTINTLQRQALIDYAIENNMEKVSFDNSEDDKVLWHIDYQDQLF